MKYSKYISAVYFTVVLLIINTITVYAQPGSDPDLPCPPDEVCPLDTWVILLVGLALIATTLYLYRRQKVIV